MSNTVANRKLQRQQLLADIRRERNGVTQQIEKVRQLRRGIDRVTEVSTAIDRLRGSGSRSSADRTNRTARGKRPDQPAGINPMLGVALGALGTLTVLWLTRSKSQNRRARSELSTKARRQPRQDSI